MKIYDISRELMSAPVYPGDSVPELIPIADISRGDDINLSEIKMCLHNATHIDAPRHYFEKKHDIEALGVAAFCGVCDVVSFDEDITGGDIEAKVKDDCERLILKTYGRGKLTPYAIMELVSRKFQIIGIDNITVGIAEADDLIHQELLKNDTILLEGLDLTDVPDGRYFLVCEPIKIKGADAAPCRAILIKDIMLY